MTSDQEEATVRIYNNNASAWAHGHHFKLEDNTFAEALRKFKAVVPKHSSVIEIGCGGGRDAAELVKNYEYFGTDAAAGMIEAARKNVPNAHFGWSIMELSMKREFNLDEAKVIGQRIGVDFTKVDAEQFRMGLAVELEHGAHDPETNVTNDDLVITGKIAWAHLKEIGDYYTRLAKLEADAGS